MKVIELFIRIIGNYNQSWIWYEECRFLHIQYYIYIYCLPLDSGYYIYNKLIVDRLIQDMRIKPWNYYNQDLMISFSNKTGMGLDRIQKLIQPGHIYCLLGSPGVRKTSLINRLLGEK